MPVGAPDYTKRILLYALYGEEATRLACDEQGRLILVVEQVSPFSRAGTILVYDTFDSGLVHVTAGGLGTGNDVSLDADEALAGSYSCKLTGGSTSDRTASITYKYSPSIFNKSGIEFAARFDNWVEGLYINALYYEADTYYQARLRYLPPSDTWELYDYGASEWVAFLEDAGYVETAHYFYTFKLIVDLENQCYHSFRSAVGLVDLTDYSLSVVTDVQAALASVQFQVVSIEGTNGVVYLDFVLLTQDES